MQVSRYEIFITWRLINHHRQTGKPPSHSATPELLQLLTSVYRCPRQEEICFEAFRKTGRNCCSSSLLVVRATCVPMFIAATALAPPAKTRTTTDRNPISNSWSTRDYRCLETLFNPFPKAS